MSKGDLNTYGNKKNNFPYQQSVLLLLDNLIKSSASAGLAQESTLISVLNAIVASDQDIEILLVRDEAVGNGCPTACKVLKQVTNYETGIPVVTYENVDGTTYVPAPNPVPVYVYLDPSAVLNLILTEITAINNKIITDDDDNAIADGQTLPLSISELYGHWDGAWQRITTDGNNRLVIAADSLPLPTGAATEATSSAINTNTSAGVRTPNIIRPTAGGTVAPITYSLSVSNVGSANGTFLGAALKPGETLNFDSGGIKNTFAANTFTYDATGTEFVIIYNT